LQSLLLLARIKPCSCSARQARQATRDFDESI